MTSEDLLKAIEESRPVSQRTVRKITDDSDDNLEWFDLGGMEAVKHTLIQVLIWPSKVQFVSCLLRSLQYCSCFRSGLKIRASSHFLIAFVPDWLAGLRCLSLAHKKSGISNHHRGLYKIY